MRYYLFEVNKDRYTRKFNDFDELIRYCASHNYYNYENTRVTGNGVFDDLSLNFNDTRSTYYYEQNVRYIKRNILIIDEHYRIIDVRLYKNLIYNYDSSVNRKKYKYKYKSRYWTDYSHLIYRKSPIPKTGKRYRRKSNIRRIHYISTNKRILRFNYIEKEDYEKYVKEYKSSISVFLDYDEYDYTKHNQKSWKKKKIRKQWQKNLK